MSEVYRKGVRAIAKGYYAGAIQNEGDTFTLTAASDFSERWMEFIDPKDAAALASDRDRQNALAASAGVVGPGRTLQVDGKTVSEITAIHEQLGDEPPKSSKSDKDEPERTKTATVGGLQVEVPESYDEDAERGKATPGIGDEDKRGEALQRTVEKRNAGGVTPSTRTAPPVATKK